MDKEKLRKIIPYVLIVIAVSMTLYSFVVMQSAENRCNDHWLPQIEEYKKEVDKKCLMDEFDFLDYGLDYIEIELPD